MSSSRTLQITYVGMKSQDVPIKSGTIKVMMKSDSEVLQEVVVTGMQKMDKRLFTGATKQLNADNVKLDGLPDISRGLEGRAAGVWNCPQDSCAWSHFHLRKFQTVVGC